MASESEAADWHSSVDVGVQCSSASRPC